jgi:hypothetical protein
MEKLLMSNIQTSIGIIFSTILLAGCNAAHTGDKSASKLDIFSGFEAAINCGMPSTPQNSVSPFIRNGDGSITLTLDDNFVGKCSKDRKGDKKAPNFERIEFKTKNQLKPNVKYRISMEAKLKGEDGRGLSNAHVSGTSLMRIGDEWNNYSLVWTRPDGLSASKKWGLPYKAYPSQLQNNFHTYTWTLEVKKGKFEIDFLIDGIQQERPNDGQIGFVEDEDAIWDGKSSLNVFFGLLRPGTRQKENTEQSITIRSVKIEPPISNN